MKIVILAGGKGTRISEESVTKPKPMVTIGGRPIIWHIMKTYGCYGFNDFIICCGYKGECIKKYFVNYKLHNAITNFTLDSCEKNGKVKYIDDLSETEQWNIVCANTGLETLTAGRILKIKKYLMDDDEFMITYGDGVSDIDLAKVLKFHHSHGKVMTISTTKPEGRFGTISIDSGNRVIRFNEKARMDQSIVNIGFMVAKKKIFDYLGDGDEMLEKGPFERLVADGQMVAYEHPGFWSPMDNIHDREYLERLWQNDAPWKKWI
ncbi:glucose-1-phosphate cytidylyltransferase RfbF2 [Butyrivibrio proteoclasticus B316]|uniref:Glucose-1-phosphate cytidylyltransferase RfbF2 n=1 Tax=Butyrivibrio proteoclasticus (strain ATCC 51982 / DSM 14932 / B316) TaxID=515622 RepID=E0S233_BUTPB|nr:glucose-1-phosphate cytidylyltransferase [Butyrivibrio proteoclasticus]ADL33858.1 glucose-1-phosphate cytidylyltransferase RfbF2 [Butyrivibrio proteoclasticus B316]